MGFFETLGRLFGGKSEAPVSFGPEPVASAPAEQPAPQAPTAGPSTLSVQAKRGKDGAVLVLFVAGRLDALTSAEFETLCLKWLEQGDKDVIFDMSRLEYASSAGLRAIMTVSLKLRSLAGTMAFCGLSDMVAGIFKTAGLLKMYPAYATLREALAHA